MATPIEHAELSAKRWGGKSEDYLEIHELMDSSKAAHADLRHRAATHNAWFVTTILERIFGKTIKNSDRIRVPVRNIGQFHVMEDFKGSYPTLTDFVGKIPFEDWMDNGKDGAIPPSNEGLPKTNLEELYHPKQAKKPKKKGGTKVLTLKPSGKGRIPIDSFFPARGCGGGGKID